MTAEPKKLIGLITQPSAEQAQLALAHAREEQAKLAAEVARLQVLLQQKEALIKKQQSDLIQFGTRQRMLKDEIIRAEAQIDLIKELLLRDYGL